MDDHPTTVLDEVVDERSRQDTKWGEQNHPDGTGPDTQPLFNTWLNLRAAGFDFWSATATKVRECAKGATDAGAAVGKVTWADILLEEVMEALAESDPVALRTELVQVAAVAVQWAEAIDRRANAEVRR